MAKKKPQTARAARPRARVRTRTRGPAAAAAGDAAAVAAPIEAPKPWEVDGTAGGFFARAPRVAPATTVDNNAQRAWEVERNQQLARESGCGQPLGRDRRPRHVGLVEQDDPTHWGGGR